MQEALSLLNEELPVHLAVRIGVNTGEVVAGDPAGGQTLVTGDAVNVAARLEQAAAPGEILLGEETYRLVRDAVAAEPVEPLELKGKSRAVSARRLVDVVRGAPAFVRRFETPVVGRERELELLRRAFDDVVRERSPKLVTVLGPPGIGKSRLALELSRSVEGEATVLTGHCLPYGEGVTFWPLAGIVRELDLVAALRGADNAELIAARIVGAVGVGEGGGSVEETFWAVRKLFEALAKGFPLVVVFEDIHWAEPALLDLIEYLAAWTRDASVLLICLARPELLEARPAWGAEKLALDPLAELEAEALIDVLHGDATLAQQTRRRIAEAAEGNPLFIEQMVALSTEHGDAELVVPPTIQALLTARLDHLEPEERAVIERASIVGRVFYWGAVVELCAEEERELVGGRLLALVRKGLVAPERSDLPNEDAFRFGHILIRDAAYSALPKETRAELHERLCDWLERKSGELHEIVGYHLEQAYRFRAELGCLDETARMLANRAGTRLAEAGRRAHRRGDMAAAANLLERAASLLSSDSPDRLGLMPDLGIALYETGELERASSVLALAIADARAAGNKRAEQHATVSQSFVRMYLAPGQVDVDEIRRVAEGAVALFEQVDDDLGLARSWNVLSEVNWLTGSAALSREAAERGAEYARRAGSRADEAEHLSSVAWSMCFGPTSVADGIEHCRTLREQAAGNPALEIIALVFLALQEATQGSFEQARDHIGQGAGASRELGLRFWSTAAELFAAYVEMLSGDPVAAEQRARAASEVLREVGSNWFRLYASVELGRALYDQGRYEEVDRLAELLDQTLVRHDPMPAIKWQGVQAKVLARRGRMDGALAAAREAVSVAERTDFLTLHGDALMDLAEVLRLAGRAGEAVGAVKEALLLYERKGNVVSAAKARAFLATARTG